MLCDIWEYMYSPVWRFDNSHACWARTLLGRTILCARCDQTPVNIETSYHRNLPQFSWIQISKYVWKFSDVGQLLMRGSWGNRRRVDCRKIFALNSVKSLPTLLSFWSWACWWQWWSRLTSTPRCPSPPPCWSWSRSACSAPRRQTRSDLPRRWAGNKQYSKHVFKSLDYISGLIWFDV